MPRKTDESAAQFKIYHLPYDVCRVPTIQEILHLRVSAFCLLPLNRRPHRVQPLEQAVMRAASLATYASFIFREIGMVNRIDQAKVAIG